MKKDRKQLFKDIIYWRKKAEREDILWRFAISEDDKWTYDMCRLCKEKVKEEDFCIYTTYRYSLYTTCHKRCHDTLQKKESYECQVIDECCNDCIFFKRIQSKKWYCSKLNRDVLSWLWISLSSDCNWKYFKHRKDT